MTRHRRTTLSLATATVTVSPRWVVTAMLISRAALADDAEAPGPPPPTGAEIELARQAATIAAQGDQLAAQQQAIERLQAALDADAKARAAAKPAVESAWSHVTISGLLQIDATTRQSSEDELRQSG